MSEGQPGPGYGIYWRTWIALLILTVIMVVLDQAAIPRTALVFILVTAMLGKASLIGANFMHLRYERLSLVVVVILLLLTGAALFFGIASDGGRILALSH